MEASTTLSSVKRQKLSSYKNSNHISSKTITKSSSSFVNLSDRKIDLVTEGFQPFYRKMLKDKLSEKNASTVCDYIISNKRESNVGIHIVKLKIQTLVNFSEFIGTNKALS